jgi:hypothetical protein
LSDLHRGYPAVFDASHCIGPSRPLLSSILGRGAHSQSPTREPTTAWRALCPRYRSHKRGSPVSAATAREGDAPAAIRWQAASISFRSPGAKGPSRLTRARCGMPRFRGAKGLCLAQSLFSFCAHGRLAPSAGRRVGSVASDAITPAKKQTGHLRVPSLRLW